MLMRRTTPTIPSRIFITTKIIANKILLPVIFRCFANSRVFSKRIIVKKTLLLFADGISSENLATSTIF